MKIGLDLDEVLAGFMNRFLYFYNEKTESSLKEEDIHSFDIPSVLGISGQKGNALFEEFYESKHFEDISTVKGSFFSVMSLRKNNELYVITARPFNIREKTENWLEKKFGSIFEELHLTNGYSIKTSTLKKSDVAKKLGLDYMVEDNIEFASDCASKGVPTLLMNKPWNQNGKMENGIYRVHGWKGVMDHFKEK
tara:strand:+ start:4407 stop:4988 length:582 start_codon:yes stop_codon:yes gene_type:complete